MGNKTALDEKTTDFVGGRMDLKHEELLKRIYARDPNVSKTELVELGVELKAKELGVYPECHLVISEIRPGLWEDEKELRARGYKDDEIGNEGIRSLSAREGLMDRTKTIIKSETTVCEGS